MAHRRFTCLIVLLIVVAAAGPVEAAQPPAPAAPVTAGGRDVTCEVTGAGEVRCAGDGAESQPGAATAAGMAAAPTASCTTLPQLNAPTLVAPADTGTLATIAPLYQWDIGADMLTTNLWLYLDVSGDPGFGTLVESLGFGYSNRPTSAGSHRFSRNLPAAQKFYWRARLACQEGDTRYGPYSATWWFVSGSGGTLPLAPQLVSPADGALVLPARPTLSWLDVSDAVAYLPKWQKAGLTGYYYTWVTAPHYTYTNDLELGAAYDWRTAALNDYGIGPESAQRRFTVRYKTALLDPAGGVVSYINSQGSPTSFEFPGGAVDQSTALTITLSVPPTNPGGTSWARHGFVLEAGQGGHAVPELEFAHPVTVTINYTDVDLAGLPEDSLKLMQWEAAEAQWEDAACGPYDRRPAENRLAAPICRTALFGLFGVYPNRVYLPLVLK
jgi:hypothetical protein